MAEDHELEVFLSLDGFECQFAEGYRVRIAAQVAETTSVRPHGIKYSLTLHDPTGRRIYGLGVDPVKPDTQRVRNEER